MSDRSVRDIFESMEYGSAEEGGDGDVKKWIASHSNRLGFFCDGKWHYPKGCSSFQVRSDGDELVKVAVAKAEDFHTAVCLARDTSKNAWGLLNAFDMGRHMHRLARTVERHSSLLASTASVESGRAFHRTRLDVPDLVAALYEGVSWAETCESFRERKRRALGVVVLSSEESSPVFSLAHRLVAALVAGNGIVIVPPRLACLSSFLLADLCKEAGIPSGVISVLVTQERPNFQIANQISVFGSAQYTAELAAIGNVVIERKYKSAAVVLESADIDSACDTLVDSLCHGAMGVDIYVQQSISGKVISRLEAKVSSLRVGPLKDKNQDVSVAGCCNPRDVMEILKEAESEGVKVVQAACSGESGDFVPPTLIIGAQPASRVSQCQTGQLLVVLPFRTIKEAANLANSGGKRYCGISVWSEDISPGMELAGVLKTNNVWLNNHHINHKTSCPERLLLDYMSKVQTYVPEIMGEENPEVLVPGQSGSVASFPMIYGGGTKFAESGLWRVIRNLSGDRIALVPHASRKDVRNAVEGATKSTWAQSSGAVRSKAMYNQATSMSNKSSHLISLFSATSQDEWANKLDKCVRCLFRAGTHNFGCRNKQVGPGLSAIMLDEPVGIIGIICPDVDSGLMAIVSALAWTLVSGNSVVLIAPSQNPHLVLELGRLFTENSDIPSGTVSVLSGPTQELTRTLSGHRDVQAIWCLSANDNLRKIVLENVADKDVWISECPDDPNVDDWKEMSLRASRFKEILIPFGETFAN